MRDAALVDSPYAWFRLGICLLMMTLGNLGMWVVPVVIPAVQAEFGVGRAESALPYTLLMLGFGAGGILMGRMADKFGLFRPLLFAGCAMGLGFVLSGGRPRRKMPIRCCAACAPCRYG